jgi:hypothetical protein
MAREERQAALLEKRRFWKEHIDGWQLSGLSQSEYCRRNDLKFDRFVYWRRTFIRPTASKASSIIEIPISAGFTRAVSLGPSPLRLVVGNHYRIEVERDFDPVALRQLIHTLGRL